LRSAASAHLRAALAPRRWLVMLLASVPLALLLSTASETPAATWAVRGAVVGTGALLAFGLSEYWPARLPRWLLRWVFQLLAMSLAVPLSAYLAYWVTVGGAPNLLDNPRRLTGFGQLTGLGIFFGLWIALAALIRQRDARVHTQALEFERERQKLRWEAADARMQLLRSQIQPHFLFNTLANVQALVEAGSPRAPEVLGALIAYLRAAVPRLEETSSSVGQEMSLARSYLELMQMRMPDRLRYFFVVADDALPCRCPPTTVLTLVENAVRHGIDPAEEGGDIWITASRDGDKLTILVEDSGVGLRADPARSGTGLNALRERLTLTFGPDAALRLFERPPHGFRAEVKFPVRESSA
jgi:signal transduction histidine kinase